MCGIAGYFGTDPPTPDRVDECLRLMRRRGPDAAASYRFATRSGPEALLLHSRLSIIDLDERANQPFRIGSHVMAYNGELYNYVELRQLLEQRGDPFRRKATPKFYCGR